VIRPLEFFFQKTPLAEHQTRASSLAMPQSVTLESFLERHLLTNFESKAVGSSLLPYLTTAPCAFDQGPTAVSKPSPHDIVGTTTRSLAIRPARVWALGPPLEAFSTPVVKRLYYDPSQTCYRGHIEVEPYGSYNTRWGRVQRYYCRICDETYPELTKPKNRLEEAILIAHYFARVSFRRLPIVFDRIAKIAQLSQNVSLKLSSGNFSIGPEGNKARKLGLVVSEATEKRIVSKYAAIAENVTADAVTRFFRPDLSGYFGIDAFSVPTLAGDRMSLIAHDLVRGDLVSQFFASKEERGETYDNCTEFMLRFRETVEHIGKEIIQIVMDDSAPLWKAGREKLPGSTVLTFDSDHEIRNIRTEFLPLTCRSPKTEALLAQIEFALRYATPEGRREAPGVKANQILDHVMAAKDYWLCDENERAQWGILQTLNSLQEKRDGLLSHWRLVRPGRRLHFYSSNRTESAIGVWRLGMRSLNCLHAHEEGQVNLISLISRLMPSSRGGRSSLQRGHVNKTLDDLMPILQMFNSSSPIQ